MRKHILNLERLAQKLQARYGDRDDLVVELKREIAALESRQSRKAAWDNPGRRKEDQRTPILQLH